MSRKAHPAAQRQAHRLRLPAFSSASDAASAMSGLLQAVAGGAVTPSEASDVGRLIEGYVKPLELTEFEKRLAALEQGKP
jgi:hypothetical protein